MSGGCSGGMDPDEETLRKLNDQLVDSLRKHSNHDEPSYSGRIKTYLELNRKRQRAAAARRNSESDRNTAAKNINSEQKDKNAENKRVEKSIHRGPSTSRDHSAEPVDKSCNRKRRRSSCGRRRRRRRSCRRKRRRRRSCSRKRRRRRSCSRKRRRRSCRRRRKKCRRCIR